jgi:hypothetical protein
LYEVQSCGTKNFFLLLVPKYFFHCQNIRSLAEQPGGKSMPEQMRTPVIGLGNSAQVFFGLPQIIDDRFSGGKAISGQSEIVVMNFCDVVVREPALIVVGAA